jgi:hypothetical protein
MPEGVVKSFGEFVMSPEICLELTVLLPSKGIRGDIYNLRLFI